MRKKTHRVPRMMWILRNGEQGTDLGACGAALRHYRRILGNCHPSAAATVRQRTISNASETVCDNVWFRNYRCRRGKGDQKRRHGSHCVPVFEL